MSYRATGKLASLPATIRRALEEAQRVRDLARATDDGWLAVERYRGDPVAFTDECLVIDDPQGHGGSGGSCPFTLWPDQRALMGDLVDATRTIILKARQLGISWVCCAYILWLVLFHPGQVVLVFSKGQDEADEMIRRVLVLYQRLPEAIRGALPKLTTEKVSALGWANGSRVRSLPATKSAGRSWTASLVIMDEAAHMMWASQLYNGFKSTVGDGGRLVILSTANGVGGLFHGLWTKATAKANEFRTVFLPWWSRPGRDRAWYDRQVAESNDPDLIKQELPATATEAFLVSGRVRFAPAWVEAQAVNCGPGWAPDGTVSLPGPLAGLAGLTIHEPPVLGPMPRRPALVAADVAEGIDVEGESGRDPDYSAAVVFDSATGAELASYRGRPEPDDFAQVLAALADWYGAGIAVERNNHGHTVLLGLRNRAADPAKHGLVDSPRVESGPDGKPGWPTTAQTKPVAVDALAAALRDGQIVVKTQAALDEMQVYRVLDGGKTGAPAGYHDDFVMAWAVGLGTVGLRREQAVYRYTPKG